MKKLEIPVYVPDYFRVPDDCDLLRLECDAHWVEFGRSYYQLKHPNLIAIKKPKPKYDWPDFFPDGTELRKVSDTSWEFYNRKGSVISFKFLANLIKLPDPPADAPEATVLVKGEE